MMTAITPADRERWAALADAATDGPWSALMATDYGPWAWWMAYPDPDDARFDWPQIQADAAFVDAARDALPALLDALDAAEAEVAEVRESLGGMVEWLAEVIVDARDACQRAEGIEPMGSPEWVESGIAMRTTALREVRAILDRERNAHPSRLDEARAAARDANDRLDKARKVLRHVVHYSATGVAEIGPDGGFAWVKATDVAAALAAALAATREVTP